MLWIAIVAGCGIERPAGLPGDDPPRDPADVDVDQVRARLDRDGDGSFDADLPMGIFTFNHGQVITPFLQAAGVQGLHGRLSFDTGISIVIPAGHPVDVFLDVLLSKEAMAAHGLLVVVDAADAAGFEEVGDVLARAGAPASIEAGQTVTLDGTASLSFIEGHELAYAWSQVGGDAVELSGADTASATFVAPGVAQETVLTFRLTVSAPTGTDSVELSVTVAAPASDGDGDVQGDPAAGQAAYATAGCGACHGEDASGASGPDLRGERTPALEQRFGGGGNHLGTTLTEQEITDVAAWLATLE
ncbi:MAG TPA: hypothetical protein VM243_17765 [Phycisphaerae bacterium]|nr:hypothetical protein [Phycisphaerae bacterium]